MYYRWFEVPCNLFYTNSTDGHVHFERFLTHFLTKLINEIRQDSFRAQMGPNWNKLYLYRNFQHGSHRYEIKICLSLYLI